QVRTRVGRSIRLVIVQQPLFATLVLPPATSLRLIGEFQPPTLLLLQPLARVIQALARALYTIALARQAEQLLPLAFPSRKTSTEASLPPVVCYARIQLSGKNTSMLQVTVKTMKPVSTRCRRCADDCHARQ